MDTDVATRIIALETAALERSGKGDISGFLELSDPDVVYFDPCVERRVDGHAALAELYKSWPTQPFVQRFELLNPKVQVIGSAAVLTFNYVSWTDAGEERWNCTEVYRRREDGEWRIVQTHWSLTAAAKA